MAFEQHKHTQKKSHNLGEMDATRGTNRFIESLDTTMRLSAARASMSTTVTHRSWPSSEHIKAWLLSRAEVIHRGAPLKRPVLRETRSTTGGADPLTVMSNKRRSPNTMTMRRPLGCQSKKTGAPLSTRTCDTGVAACRSTTWAADRQQDEQKTKSNADTHLKSNVVLMAAEPRDVARVGRPRKVKGDGARLHSDAPRAIEAAASEPANRRILKVCIERIDNVEATGAHVQVDVGKVRLVRELHEPVIARGRLDVERWRVLVHAEADMRVVAQAPHSVATKEQH